jgi:mannitol-specific phosphotransferase system IIBC component
MDDTMDSHNWTDEQHQQYDTQLKEMKASLQSMQSALQQTAGGEIPVQLERLQEIIAVIESGIGSSALSATDRAILEREEDEETLPNEDDRDVSPEERLASLLRN